MICYLCGYKSSTPYPSIFPFFARTLRHKNSQIELFIKVTIHSYYGSKIDPDKFTNLVEHVLQNCSSTNLLELDLSCPSQIDLSQLNTWVETVLMSPKIQNLRLWINKYFYELPEPPLPICILSCNSLVVLRLDSCFDIQIPESVICFPCHYCLKYLN